MRKFIAPSAFLLVTLDSAKMEPIVFCAWNVSKCVLKKHYKH